MSESKSLKDFFCNNREGLEGSECANCGMNHTITEEFLKKDAIDDIEELRRNFKHGIFNFSCSVQDNLEEYIKWKFNITEKEVTEHGR